MGATTYTVMAAHWPGDSSPFAKPMNETPKVVFSVEDRLVHPAAAGGDPDGRVRATAPRVLR